MQYAHVTKSLQIKLNVEKVESHAADFFAFFIHKVVCF